MRRRSVLPASLVVALVAACRSAPRADCVGRRDARPGLVTAAPVAAGSIVGVIVSLPDGGLVEAAQVVLPALERGAISSAHGQFHLAAVPPGAHTLVARRIGYITAETAIELPPDSGLALTLALRRSECPTQVVQ